jgi:hypothetical protein
MKRIDTPARFLGWGVLAGMVGATLFAFLMKPRAGNNGRFFADYPVYRMDDPRWRELP